MILVNFLKPFLYRTDPLVCIQYRADTTVSVSDECAEAAIDGGFAELAEDDFFDAPAMPVCDDEDEADDEAEGDAA